jgi:hypothetical protein
MEDGFFVISAYPETDLFRLWQEFMAQADYATYVTSPEYLAEPLVQQRDRFAVIAVRAGRIVAAVTGYRREKQIVCGFPGSPQVALVPCADKLVERQLVQGLLRAADKAHLITVYGWTPLDAFAEFGFRSKRLTGIAMLDLRLGPEALMHAFPKRRQTYIRKAIRQGVEVYESRNWEEFHEYYDVYVAWSKRKGLPILSSDTLLDIYRHRNCRRLFIARHRGKLIAALVVRVYPGGVAEFVANNWLQEFQHLRPNDLLHWRAIEWACSQGYGWYKLGVAPYLRERFGAKVVPTYRVRSDRTLLGTYDKREFVEMGLRRVRKLLRNVTSQRTVSSHEE